MQIGPLNIPAEVLSALEEKRLVIFAGAGVSIPPPSNLLGFEGLVAKIVGQPLKDDEKSQLDRVLGRAQDRGIPVHKLAKEHLTQPGSRFNPLHESLVALFGPAEAVRIVTTNFDPHFGEALAARNIEVDCYTAPALPVGSSFRGLVHLHGSLDHEPETLVLTDADFGRAYITEGWAGRFVLDLFREFTVLFVGYSYGDTVMSYLTRGLSPGLGQKRFALTERGKGDHWELLGIQPIEYDPANHHRALADGLEAWVRLEKRGFLDWDQRLPELVTKEPQRLAPDELGELDFCLKNPKRAKLFYRQAQAAPWLDWAKERGLLRPLFSFEGNQEALSELAHWFAGDPLGDRGKAALRIALTEVQPVGEALAVAVIHQVRNALANVSALTEAQERRVAAWATLLVERTARTVQLSYIGSWLMHLSAADHPEIMVQILAYLLRPQPVFKEPWWPEELQERDLSLETRCWATDWISRHWEPLRKQIGPVASLLVPVLTETLETRWRWLRSLEHTTSGRDRWTWKRSWVERPPGVTDHHYSVRRGGELLLDIGRAVLDELLANQPERAANVINQWLAAGAPQLQQLGLYGLAKSSRWRPARKIERLTREYLPARKPFKIEAFRVLGTAYPGLTERQRAAFIRRAKPRHLRVLEEHQENPDARRSAAYEWYNLLVWLQRSAPDDPLLETEIEQVLAAQPEFKPLEHPELGPSVETASVSPKSSLTVEEILERSPAQWLEEYFAAQERQNREWPPQHPADGFLNETGRAANQSFRWGLSLARELHQRQEAFDEVWRAILRGWKAHNFTPDDWKKLVDLLDEPRLLQSQAGYIVEILGHCTEQKDPEATEAMLLDGLRLAENLFPLMEEESFDDPRDSPDWLSEAINHSGGRLTEFLVQVTGRLVGSAAPQGHGLPVKTRPLLDAIVAGQGKASEMGRVILASQLHYFLGIDSDWTLEKLVPLFNWAAPRQAMQAWHAFLFWGRPTTAAMQALSDAATMLPSHLEELGEQREHYGQFIASAAYASPDDPFSKPWFQAFLSNAVGEDRAQFARRIDELLEHLTADQKAELWSGWLRQYIEHRSRYAPPPESEERNTIFGWAFRLPGQLDELIPLLEKLPGHSQEIDRPLWKLKEGELQGSDPDLLARLLLALLRGGEKVESWHLDDFYGAIERLIRDNTDKGLAKQLVDKYLEHGGQNHGELLRALETRGGTERPAQGADY